MREKPVYEEEYKGFTIKIYPDDLNESPCDEWDMFGTMICWHDKYNLGHHEKVGRLDTRDWLIGHIDFECKNNEDCDVHYMSVEELMSKFEEDNLVLPLFLYDHSGITMRCSSFGDPWDSGQVGFIYASYDDVRKEFGGKAKRLTKGAIEKAKKCLMSEVDAYDDYLTGNIYGYVVEDENGEDVDSCWGYYGYYDESGILDEARGHVDWELKERDNARWIQHPELDQSLAFGG